MKYSETLNTLDKCFGEIEELMAIITERLRGRNIPVKALFIESWPINVNNQAMYKIWDGLKHVEPINGGYEIPSILTAYDILEIVKRKEILMRKFQ